MRLYTFGLICGASLLTGAVGCGVHLSPTNLVIATSSPLSPAIVGVAYSQRLTATGGIPPYTWSVSSGSFPPDLY